MIFTILPVTVYTLFIMRMKPNNKQNTSRISNCTAKKVPAGLFWEPSTSRWPCHWLGMIPSVHWTAWGPRPRGGQFLLLRVFWSNRNSTSTSTGSAVRPWAWIHWVSDLQLLSRLYRPFKVPHATVAYTAVLWIKKHVEKQTLAGKGTHSVQNIKTWFMIHGENTNRRSRPAWRCGHHCPAASMRGSQPVLSPRVS